VSTWPDKAYFHRLCGESVQNLLPQQVQLGSPTSQAFDQLDPANLTFALAGVLMMNR
jgi:hypothetical protein